MLVIIIMPVLLTMTIVIFEINTIKWGKDTTYIIIILLAADADTHLALIVIIFSQIVLEEGRQEGIGKGRKVGAHSAPMISGLLLCPQSDSFVRLFSSYVKARP